MNSVRIEPTSHGANMKAVQKINTVTIIKDRLQYLVRYCKRSSLGLFGSGNETTHTHDQLVQAEQLAPWHSVPVPIPILSCRTNIHVKQACSLAFHDVLICGTRSSLLYPLTHLWMAGGRSSLGIINLVPNPGPTHGPGYVHYQASIISLWAWSGP